jgi:flagellar biosynthetic protein FliR
MLADYLTAEIYNFLLVFCRVGSCFMVMPAFGASYVPPRVRLVLAIAVSFAVVTTVAGFPKMPGSAPLLAMHLMSEIIIGIMIGTIAKILASAIHIAGMIISMQSSLNQASLFDPNQGAQSSVFGTFMDMCVLVLIFTLNVHHVMILAIADSYNVFAPVSEIPFADFASLTERTVTKAFVIGLQLSMPMIIVGVLINLASGLLARLMPSFQVYFVIMPAQILVCIFIFMTTFSAGLMWYMGVFGDAFYNMFG